MTRRPSGQGPGEASGGAVTAGKVAPGAVPNGTVGSATASCRPGERATGGGALPLSAPTALAFALGTAQLVAYAICARAG